MSQWPKLETLTRRVGVVVTARDHARHLPATLYSVVAQTHAPERIVLVDDGSQEDVYEVAHQFPKVLYTRVDLGKGLTGNPARRQGVSLLGDVNYVCCIDGDGDYVPPDYLERLLEAIEADCRSAVAYPRLRLFGDRQGVVDQPFSRETLRRTNIAPVSSLIRADAYRQAGGWPDVPTGACQDWSMWRRICDLGWRMAPANTEYFWRRHPASLSATVSGRPTALHQMSWAASYDTTWNFVTVAIPFAGRDHCVGRLFQALEDQSFPHERVSVLFYDNSGSARFGERLRRWLAHCDYAETRYIRDDRRAVMTQTNQETAHTPLLDREGNVVRAVHAINDHVAAIWNRIGQLVSTDFIWCLEEDVIPPRYALERLVEALGPQTDAVTAAYPNRHPEHPWCAFEFPSLSPLRGRHVLRNAGCETIGGCGLGCVLLRKEILQDRPARSLGDAVEGARWYDWNLWADAARVGQRLVIDWDVMCEHLID